MSAFHCQHCGNVTDVTNILQSFEDIPHCPRCGLSIHEADTKMQDELADLMANNLRLNQIHPPVHDMSAPSTPQTMPQTTPLSYVSQHYHHSTHVAPLVTDAEVPITQILRDAGVNAQVLLPCQLQLFKNAQEEQRARLIELWSIAPPTYGNQLMAEHMANWPQTSFEREEQAARQRWDKQEQERLKNLSVLPESQDARMYVEPYMSDGYSKGTSSGVRSATDPAYAPSREWWHMSEDEPTEHQYGMLQQLRMGHDFVNTSNDKDQMMS